MLWSERTRETDHSSKSLTKHDKGQCREVAEGQISTLCRVGRSSCGIHEACTMGGFRKGWSKIPMRNHYTPTRVSKITGSGNSAGEDAEKLDSLYIAVGNVKWKVV